MKPQSMTAIEYNTWMSVIDFISKQLPLVSDVYGLSGLQIQVAPSYPRDLTKFRRPAIIVQKIHINSHSVGFGNVLGQYIDPDDGAAYDVSGTIHDMIYQLDINSDSNKGCSLLTDALCDTIRRSYNADYGSGIDLVDFAGSKLQIGTIKVDHDFSTTPLASNDNKDYASAVRIDLNVIQSVVDINQPMVDLSKPIKWTQTINL